MTAATTFADTYYYLALLNVRDRAHARAVAAGHDVKGPIVTTAWVLQEVADGLASPKTRNSIVRLIDAIGSDPYSLVVGPTEELWRRDLGLYRTRPTSRGR